MTVQMYAPEAASVKCCAAAERVKHLEQRAVENGERQSQLIHRVGTLEHANASFAEENKHLHAQLDALHLKCIEHEERVADLEGILVDQIGYVPLPSDSRLCEKCESVHKKSALVKFDDRLICAECMTRTDLTEDGQ